MQNTVFSDFGAKFAKPSGISELMEELGNAMSGRSDVIMMGGGNPALVPAVSKYWRKLLRQMLAKNGGPGLDKLLGYYDGPQGNPDFLEAVASYFRERYGFKIGAENVAVTNGSQSATFILMNLLAGRKGHGHQQILLPMCPEYIGYAEQGLSPNFFKSQKAKIQVIGDHEFKYHIDFDQLNVTRKIAALCISRPTNPSGNVISDSELMGLTQLCSQAKLPLLLDNAYGSPFPEILYTKVKLSWNSNVIYCFSLSKMGLPALRTGIVIAKPQIIKALSAANATLSLATGNLGQALTLSLFQEKTISDFCKKYITPFYENKRTIALDELAHWLPADLPWRIHRSEGAMFLWLWMDECKLDSQQLYLRLKQKGLLVVPGHHFFSGYKGQWKHSRQCLRITFSQSSEGLIRGAEILGKAIKQAYSQRYKVIKT